MTAHRRVLLASLIGTSVEFYDFYIYATAAALVFGPLFFPAEDASAQLLLSYASFGLAFIARPVGAAVFGHFGDRIGRKSTLVASLMLMGGSTVAIAFLPTYAQIGWVAPLILCVLRFGQGLGLGGEWGGASLLAVENAPPGWRNRYGMFPPLGAPVGFIAANGFFLLLGLMLTDAQFRDWGWRLPFLASAVLVGLGLWVRLKLTETPAFLEAKREPLPRVPIVTLFRDHLRATLAGTFAVVACFALFYLATAFALGYGTTVLGHELTDAQFRDWGWRLPFLASAVLVGLGLWVRLKLTETPAFLEAKREPLPRVPIVTLFRDHLRATLAGTFAVVACFALFYLATAFALGYGTTVLGHDRQAFLMIELAAIPFLAFGVILANILADLTGGGAKAMLRWGFAGCAAAGLLMGPMLGAASLFLVWLWLAFALFVMGFAYGPLGGWLPELFPARVRYTGVSMTFNVGGILGGALAPIAASWLATRGGLGLVGVYLLVAGMLSLGGLMLLRGAPRSA